MPLVVGMTTEGAKERLAQQPLAANVVYAPAKPGHVPGIVLSQDPRSGGLSANTDVTIWVSKARYGALPNFVGSSVRDVEREAARLHVRLQAKTAPGRSGTVVRQSPDPGVAIAPGLRVKLVVGDGSRT